MLVLALIAAHTEQAADEPSRSCQFAPMAQLTIVSPSRGKVKPCKNIPSPRTTLRRLAAKKAMLVANFILKIDIEEDVSVEACLSKSYEDGVIFFAAA